MYRERSASVGSCPHFPALLQLKFMLRTASSSRRHRFRDVRGQCNASLEFHIQCLGIGRGIFWRIFARTGRGREPPMNTLMSFSGIVGAACCVGMYAAVCFGKVSADKPLFYLINGVGAGLVLVGAAHQFDVGDLGTIGQELIWAAISVAGGVRAYLRENNPNT
jgi:hypothetical protein